MKRVRLVAQDLGEDILVNLGVRDDMNRADILEAIQSAYEEFLSTEAGKELYKENGVFDYAAFAKYVPDDICEKYGIEKEPEPDNIILVDNVLLGVPEEMEESLESESNNMEER